MNQQITTYSSYLLACLPHIDEFHYMDNLRYIHVCDGYMAASNAHTTIILEDDALKGCNFLIPVQAIRELDHIFKDDPDLEYPHINIDVYENGLGSLWTDGSFEIRFVFGGHKTQDFKKLHGNKPEQYSGIPPIFNATLLGLFQESQHYLYGSLKLGVQVYPSGVESMAYVEIDEGVYGAIMPLDQTLVREAKTLGYEYRGRDILRIQNRFALNSTFNGFQGEAVKDE